MKEEIVNNTSNWWPIIAIIVSGVIGWGSSIINSRNERKKITLERELQDQKWDERDRLVMDRITGMENKVVELSMSFLEFRKNNEFRSRLMNMFRAKATNIIDYNVDLNPKYKHLLMKVAREFEDFALRFYYSDMRGVEHQISQYLKIDMESRIDSIENIMRRINPKPKKFKYSTGKTKPIYFVDYIKESILNKEIRLLIIILQRNGLSPDDVVKLFDRFISNLFKEFIVLVNDWEDMEDLVDDEDNDYLFDGELNDHTIENNKIKKR